MFVDNMYEIGNRFLFFRKKKGLTQMELAEIAGLSDRTYADIERGTVNMRIETFIRICRALSITPNEILLAEPDGVHEKMSEERLIEMLNVCNGRERDTAVKLLSVYLNSLQ